VRFRVGPLPPRPKGERLLRVVGHRYWDLLCPPSLGRMFCSSRRLSVRQTHLLSPFLGRDLRSGSRPQVRFRRSVDCSDRSASDETSASTIWATPAGVSQRRDGELHRVTLGGRRQVRRRGTCKGVRAGSGGRRRRVGQGGGRCRGTAGRSGDGHGCRRGAGGARGWSWWRAVMWAMARVGSVSGDRSGWAAASWSKTWPGRAQLARLQRRHLGTHAQLHQRHPAAHHGLDAH
jgi:hypothetical protein